ncbi:MAG: methyltransferase domain-containing protein [Planctomycetes bacterium]|nr:methyltransferase domain-containing protein [Planctomycetota bacterium]
MRPFRRNSRPLRADSAEGPPFPGRVLPRELWTRTRAQLGDRGKRFAWDLAFGRQAPRVVDLGCGNGRWLISSALARPDVDHLGVELVPPAVKLGSLRAGQRGLRNCKLAWGDATEFILERCEPESLDEVHLYHPQPYYDARKRARRQLSPEVLRAIHRALKPGGLFVFQTDNPAYAEYARRVVPLLFEWRELPGPWPDAPEGRTLREIVARSKGLEILRAEARRLELPEIEAARRISQMPTPDFDANRPEFRAGLRPSARRRQR